ncbi:hypothetical protein DFQ14_10425 [Halopolyspora algeriensis]|uniref:DUF5313 family protein n=2 Tax=Halopolyspora algeriensis TaxID=1500506 RepID=A0A368VTA6_9ACTN|nr:hypothetical protein DFQ14_10425 [Halopolyspora algeriensis]TQM55797.1 hypothetical protein FHU43_0573 [Halopolyspora algeriensis]
MSRPNPLQWVWYAYGGKLPDRCAEWVLHDVTCRTWVLRQLARALMQLAPLCVVVLLLPGPLSIRVWATVLGLLVGLFYSVSAMVETAEHRAIKHGHAPGLARETRELYRDVRRETKWAARRRRER